MFKFKIKLISRLSLVFVIILGCALISNCKKSCKEKTPPNPTPPIVQVVPSISITNGDATLKVNQELQLASDVVDVSGTLVWTTSDASIVTVTQEGLIKSKKVGQATIKLTSFEDISVNDSISVNVVTPSIEASFSDEEFYIGEEGKLNIKFNYTPDEIVSYKSTDETVATIDENGNVKALKEGLTYLKANLTNAKSVSTTYKLMVIHPLVDEEDYRVLYISTGPGENSSEEAEINYHTFNTKTSLEYTEATDESFANKKVVKGNSYYFDYHGDLNDTPTVPQNVVRVSLKGLTPNTKYIYRINCGNDTYTETYSFVTSKNDGENSSFIMLADVHYSTLNFDYAGAEISEKVITSALAINPNANLVISAGDLIDTGGNPAIWDVFYEKASSLKNIMWSTVPGNHEYYFSGTSFTDFRFFKAFSASVYNGPSTHIGSSCWYLYNDILFLMVDNNLYTAEQNAWLEDVLENVEAKWKIAVMHVPIERDNTDRDEKMMAIFDRFSVDLVFQGHYHGDCYNENYYEGAFTKDPYLGVNYLTGAGGGVKGLGDNSQADSFAKGYLVDVTNETMTIKLIDATGKLINTRVITSKNNAEAKPKTKEELKNSLKYVLDNENHTLEFTWSDFYLNVKKLTFIDLYRNEVNKEVFIPTPSYNHVVFKNIIVGYNYGIDIQIEYMDGTTETVNYTINNGADMKLTVNSVTNNSIKLNLASLPDDLLMMVKSYDIYINGSLYDSIYSVVNDVSITSYTVNNLFKNTSYHIEVKATTYENGIAFAGEVNTKTAE